MRAAPREVYVISDLHLGGAAPVTPGDERGFRICTHSSALADFVDALSAKAVVELVINGDLVDFLAEENDDGGWSSFTWDENAVIRKLDCIVEREAAFFRSLSAFLRRGHRLTLLLGNHDIELALPAVRRRLRHHLGITPTSDFQFVYDGEAYEIGGVLIEHGNRYDPFNVVDHDSLRRLRSLLSRHQPVAPDLTFQAPAGSCMVAEVINPIKVDYKLIDLLKPETAAAVPILLALEPGYRGTLKRIAELSLKARRHKLKAPALPSFAGDISLSAVPAAAPMRFTDDISAGPSAVPADPLGAALLNVLHSPEAVAAFLPPVREDFTSDISTRSVIDRTLGLTRLFVSSDKSSVESRLSALLLAVRALHNDTTFDRGAENATEYLEAARELASHGFHAVIFGHTHIARDVALPDRKRYLNSGTWADLIRFPADVLKGTRDQAINGLRGFVEDLSAGRLAKWTSFTPTYVRFVVHDNGSVGDLALHEYDGTLD